MHSFLQAQVAVKDSKRYFEKLKLDLSEKIDMVFASRCNLLSRSLPFYQKELLSFCDRSAGAFHKILVDLRSHHHHQYKVKRLLEEIRHLESEETPIAPELQRTADDADDDDEPLLNVGAEVFEDGVLANQSLMLVDEGVATVHSDGELPPRESDPFSFEQVLSEAGVSDLFLAGSEAALGYEQADTTTPQEQSNGDDELTHSATEEPSLDKINDLLNFDEATVDRTPAEAPSKEEVLDEWGNFSAFMSSDKETDNPHSGWESECVSAAQRAYAQSSVAAPTQLVGETQGMQPSLADDMLSDLLSDDLKLLGLDTAEELKKPAQQEQQLSADLESLDPLLFQAGQQPPPSMQQPPPPSMQQPPPPLLAQQPSVFRSPMSGSQMPIIPPGPNTQNQAGAAAKGGSPKKPVKKGEGKGSAWMSVFAHLDPLQNEKA